MKGITYRLCKGCKGPSCEVARNSLKKQKFGSLSMIKHVTSEQNTPEPEEH